MAFHGRRSSWRCAVLWLRIMEARGLIDLPGATDICAGRFDSVNQARRDTPLLVREHRPAQSPRLHPSNRAAARTNLTPATRYRPMHRLKTAPMTGLVTE